MSPSHTSKQISHVRRVLYASSEGWHTLKVACSLRIPVRRSLHSNLSRDTSRNLKIHGTKKSNPNLQLAVMISIPVELRKTVFQGLVLFPRYLFVRASIVHGITLVTVCSSLALSPYAFHWKTQFWTMSRGRYP